MSGSSQSLQKDFAVDGGDVLFLRTTGGVDDAAFDQRGYSAEGGRALGSRNGPTHVGGLVGVLVSCDATVAWDPLYSNGGITATELLAQVVDGSSSLDGKLPVYTKVEKFSGHVRGPCVIWPRQA